MLRRISDERGGPPDGRRTQRRRHAPRQPPDARRARAQAPPERPRLPRAPQPPHARPRGAVSAVGQAGTLRRAESGKQSAPEPNYEAGLAAAKAAAQGG